MTVFIVPEKAITQRALHRLFERLNQFPDPVGWNIDVTDPDAPCEDLGGFRARTINGVVFYGIYAPSVTHPDEYVAPPGFHYLTFEVPDEHFEEGSHDPERVLEVLLEVFKETDALFAVANNDIVFESDDPVWTVDHIVNSNSCVYMFSKELVDLIGVDTLSRAPTSGAVEEGMYVQFDYYFNQGAERRYSNIIASIQRPLSDHPIMKG